MKVNTLERQTSRVTPSVSAPKGANPPAAAFGGEMAEAATKLGETGSKIATAILQRAQERNKEIMTKQVLDQDTTFRQELQNTLYNDEPDKNGRPLGFLSRKLGQTQNSTQEFDQTYPKIKQKYLDNVPHPSQKEALARILDQNYITTRDNIIRHERQQTDESIQKSFNSNIDIQVNDAAQLQDGPSVIRAINQAVITQDELSRISGYDDKTKEAERIKVRGKIAKSAFSSAMTENDLAKAQSIYNSIKGEVPAEIAAKMKEEIDSGIPYRIAVSDAFLDPISTRQKLEKNAYAIKDPVKRKAAYDFTNTLAERMISGSQETRHNALLDKAADHTLTLRDVENEQQVPEEQGGIKKTILLKYQNALQSGINRDLNRMLKEQTTDNEPTGRAKAVKQYVDLINDFVSDDTDKWRAREKLAEAYADGIISPQEGAFLNKLKTGLKDIEFNRSTGPIINSVKAVKSWLKNNNASDEEITLRIKQLLGTLEKGEIAPQEAAKAKTLEHFHSKIPEAATFPAKGQLMMDAYGNQAMVYPDGTIEPVLPQAEKTPGDNSAEIK